MASNHIPFVISSLSGSPVSLKVAGLDPVTVSMRAVGLDNPAQPQAGFIGTVSLLPPGSDGDMVRYKVIQDGNIERGRTYHRPSSTSDASFIVCGCDNSGLTAGSDSAWEKVWASDIKLVVFVDDFGYIDNARIDDTAGTGHKVMTLPDPPASIDPPNDYDYALGWLLQGGLLDDTTTNYISWANDPYRQWCYRNIPLLPQFGDHEFNNEIGWAALYPNHLAVGLEQWNNFIDPLLLNAQRLTGGHKAWASEYGNVLFCAPEFHVSGNGKCSHGDPMTENPPIVNGDEIAYGNDQITDVLTALNTDHLYKVLVPSGSIKYMSNSIVGAERDHGCQNPLKDNVPPEYQRLFTDSGETPQSIMDNPKLNGTTGRLVVAHGDYHNYNRIHHNQSDGDIQEDFHEVHTGAINGSVNFDVDAVIAPGGVFPADDAYTYNGSTFNHIRGGVGEGGTLWQWCKFTYLNADTSLNLETKIENDTTIDSHKWTV